MSTETNKKDEVQIIPATAPVVKRNGIEVTLTEQIFGKLSDWAGHKFWGPVIDVSNSDHVTWAVAESLNSIVNKELRLIFAGIYQDAVKEKTDTASGKLDVPKFEAQLAEDWADFTAGVSKLSDLEEQIGLLQDQIAPLVSDTDFVMPEEGQAPTARFIELSTKMRELNRRIVPLRKQLADIKEIYKVRADNRKKREARSTTQTAVPAEVKG